MNGLDWRNSWDLAVIERERRDDQLEWRRMLREADITPGGTVARVVRAAGAVLVAAGQALAGEPVRSPAKAIPAA